MRAIYSNKINPDSVRNYLKVCKEHSILLRSLRVYRQGEELSVTLPPFREDDAMHLYSLSKSFTSTCVGIAQDLGLLSVNERMIDIFPEDIPEKISDRLSSMTLGDVLSMQSGHDVCHLNEMRFSSNAVKTFLAMPIPYQPGTTFVYSTGGTCVCGAAVAKRSGMPLSEFMDKYLFSKLHIQNRPPIHCADGTHCGGIGIFVTPDELFRFGMMLLNKGDFEGQQIVSKAYLEKATSKIADNSSNGTPDWIAGYGYQFWRNGRGGFRGDGAYGQLCIILPEEDTVFVQMAEANNMQDEFNLIYDFISHLFDAGAGDAQKLEDEISGFYQLPESDDPVCQEHMLQNNPGELTKITVEVPDSDTVYLWVDTAYGLQKIVAGRNEWMESSPMLRYCNPSINSLDPAFGQIETLHLRSRFLAENGSLKIICKHPDTPHTQTFSIDEDALRLSTFLGDLHPDMHEIRYQ